jgi:hypothetical protein
MSGPVEELSRPRTTKADLARATRELRELIGIGVRLAAERDTEALLDLILTTARESTWSDAGTLYLLDVDGTGRRGLRATLVQNDSLPVAVKEHASDRPAAPPAMALSGEVSTWRHLASRAPYTIDARGPETGHARVDARGADDPGGEVSGAALINRPDRAGVRPRRHPGEAVRFPARPGPDVLARRARWPREQPALRGARLPWPAGVSS